MLRDVRAVISFNFRKDHLGHFIDSWLAPFLSESCYLGKLPNRAQSVRHPVRRQGAGMNISYTVKSKKDEGF